VTLSEIMPMEKQMYLDKTRMYDMYTRSRESRGGAERLRMGDFITG
jgi:hypothetical protein